MSTHPVTPPAAGASNPSALAQVLGTCEAATTLRVTLVHGAAVPRSLLAHVGEVLRGTPGVAAAESLTWLAGESEDHAVHHALVSVRSDGPVDVPATAAHVRGELRGLAIAMGTDLAVTYGELAVGRVRLIVSDADSTFFRGEVIDELAHHAGSGAQVQQITAAAMRGELDFADSLRARVRTLAGLDAGVLETVAEQLTPSPGALNLLARAHAAGARVAIVSGGFTPILERARERFGFDELAANGLQVDGGRLTGEVEGPVVDRAAKAEHLRRWAREAGAQERECAAVGDGANDLDLLAAAGLGTAYAAKPATAEAADAVISGPRLDVLAEFLALPR